MGEILSEFFDASAHQFVDNNLAGAASPENLFGIFDVFDGLIVAPTLEETRKATSMSDFFMEPSDGLEVFEAPKSKKQKHKHKQSLMGEKPAKTISSDEANLDGEQKMSHIAVERNRRKQMNEHLTVLRSLMPCFYVKRGDQASIIGGVVDYINELQQVLQSLEAKKQRKVYSEVLSPRLASSPRVSPSLLSPRKPPLSPRLNLPISPRTPPSPYKLAPRLLPNNYYSPSSSSSSTTITTAPNSPIANIVSNNNELVAAVSKSPVADVEVKFSGSNVLLKTVSSKINGQVLTIISALEALALEILHVNVSTIDDTMVNSFTIKIGIECQLSAEELAHQIQQTFC